MTSAMSGVLEFLGDIGIFDILLPFLMIYVMIFALLERTMIFGQETFKVDGEQITIPKRNLNAVFAFAVAFFAILSSRVVQTIHRAIGPVMILLLIIILLIVLVSVFKTKDGKADGGIHDFAKMMPFFIGVILLSIALIFLNSIHTEDGTSWLESSWNFVTSNADSGFVGAIILLVLVAGFIYWMGKSPSPSTNSGGGSK